MISAATILEIGIVLDQSATLSKEGVDRLDAFLTSLQIGVAAFTETHAQIAREAYRRYGKGRHPAGLNFGDCMSYALAKSLDDALQRAVLGQQTAAQALEEAAKEWDSILATP